MDDPRDAPTRTLLDRWAPLGRRPPAGLEDARLQLHQLAQIPAAFAGRFVAPETDDSHRSLVWSPALGGFHSRGAEVAGNVFVVVRPLPLEVEIRAVGDARRYGVRGRTLQAVWEWAEEELSRLLGPEAAELTRPEFDLPEHRVAAHAPFDASLPELEELARWFGDAAVLLAAVRAAHRQRASPVRTWPHHFDMAPLLDFGAGPDGTRRTVGVGLSPGDDARPAPYLYVAPWPRPETAPEDALPAGCWQEMGWVGAVLPAEELIRGTGSEQEARAMSFVAAALGTARKLIDDAERAESDRPSGS